MLWKLLKYDFRAMVKSFAILWPASLVVALVNRFTIPFDQPLDNELLAVVTMVAFFSVLFAMCVAVLIFIVQRFYKGLLGDEGYLMHTLPVRTWQLVASKLICALVTSVVSIAVAILAIIILFPIKWETVFNLATFRALWAALTRRDFTVYHYHLFGHRRGPPVPAPPGGDERGRIHCPGYSWFGIHRCTGWSKSL